MYDCFLGMGGSVSLVIGGCFCDGRVDDMVELCILDLMKEFVFLFVVCVCIVVFILILDLSCGGGGVR